MARVSKKQKGAGKEMESRDRLSELPDEVLIHILSFLHTFYAVRTMLIRRFGELWTLVPNLDFSEFHMPFNTNEKHRFHIFVRNVLLLHQAPIVHSFRLETDFDEEAWSSESVVKEIHVWIKCAIRKQPKIVHIQFLGETDFPLPQCLFISQSVVGLSLIGCEFKHQKRVHMGSLRSLRLEYVRLVEIEILRDMISGFPSLEKLEICDCYVNDLTLPSESIQKLVFQKLSSYEGFHSFYCPKVKVLHMSCYRGCFDASDLLSVCEASITFCDALDRSDVPADQTTKLLKKLENAQILTFSGLSLKGATFPQNQWKVLKLTNQYDTKPCIPWILNLLGNSPYLEELTIDARDRYKPTCKCVRWKRDPMCPKMSSPFVAHQLRKVDIHSENEYNHQFLLQLVELFLNHAIVLVELVISFKWGIRITSTKKHNLFKKISRFTRASANARVTIY